MPLLFYRTPFPWTPGVDEYDWARIRRNYGMFWPIQTVILHRSNGYPGVGDFAEQAESVMERNYVITHRLFGGTPWTPRRPQIEEQLAAIWEQHGWPGSHRDHRLQFRAGWSAFSQFAKTTPISPGNAFSGPELMDTPLVAIAASGRASTPAMLAHRAALIRLEV